MQQKVMKVCQAFGVLASSSGVRGGKKQRGANINNHKSSSINIQTSLLMTSTGGISVTRWELDFFEIFPALGLRMEVDVSFILGLFLYDLVDPSPHAAYKVKETAESEDLFDVPDVRCSHERIIYVVPIVGEKDN